MPPQLDKQIPPPHALQLLQSWLDNGLHEIASNKIKEWGMKLEVHNGKLVDTSDSTEAWLRRFITINNRMMAMKDKVIKLSKVNDEVLITGETGTGKEIIAHALHGDRNGRFIGVNCAGIPEQLVESLLFGHVKGSFTGATDTKNGLMMQAKDGTLFLDEIGELPLMSQAKFLRAIQERKITKVGGDKEEDISCRIVCATHKDLWAMVDHDTFRLDLYARLSTFELWILPLRERWEDVLPILKALEENENNIHMIITRIDRANLLKYLPLNVRSLQQMVKRYKVLGELPE